VGEGTPVHEGDPVVVRGRPGVWRVLWVRRGAARVEAVGDGTRRTVGADDLRPLDEDEWPAASVLEDP
jgi:hypothetical protein